MKKLALFLLLFLFFSHDALRAQSPAIEWQKCYGGNHVDDLQYIEPTADGGYIMIGLTDGPGGDIIGYHGNPELGDYWVVKLDNTGAIQWSKCLGGTFFDQGAMIHQAADGSFMVAGEAASLPGDGDMTATKQGGTDYWLVKLSAGGNILWQKCYGGEKNEYIYDFRFTADGGYILAGETESVGGDVSGNHGGRDAWIVKLNSAGNIDWQRCVGGSQDDEAYAVAVLNDGYVITGYTSSNDGNLTGFHGGTYDVLAAKLDLNGNVVWAKALGGSGQDYGWGVAKSAGGGAVLGGWTQSTDGNVSGNHGFGDFWAIQLDNAGNVQWQHCYGGSLNDFAYALSATPDGGYLLAGSAESHDGDVTCKNATAYHDGWVIKISATGVLQWQKTLSGGYADEEHSINPTPDGGVIVGGYVALSNLPSYHVDLSAFHTVGDFYVAKLGASAGAGAPVSISIAPPPANSCAGTSLMLTAATTGVPAGATYQWFRNGSDMNNNAPSYTAANFSNGDQVYCKVTLMGINCTPVSYNSNTVIFSVSTLAAPGVSISANAATICSGSPTTFTAAVTNGHSAPVYQWLLNGNPVGTNNPAYTSSVLVNGDQVSCVYSDNTACVVPGPDTSNKIVAQVTPSVTPAVGIKASATTVCAGSALDFQAAPVNGGTAPAYQWEVNGSPAGSNSPVYTSTLANGDVVSCVLSSSAACSTPATVSSNSIAVTVNAVTASSVRIDYSPVAACIGKPVIFTANPAGEGPAPVYQWQVNGANVGTNSPSYASSTLSDGDRVSCLLSDKAGCIASSSGSVSPAIYPTPAVATGRQVNLPKGQGMTLDLSPTGDITTYLWSPATGLSDPSIADPVATPLVTTTYTLLVTTAKGCQASGDITVSVFSKLSIPQAFTPNGDGHNDIFYIMGGPLDSRVKDFAVFSQWGQQVFHVHDVAPGDPAFGWNGRINGADAPTGTYVYEIRIGLADGTQKMYTGTVVLVR